ncbi:hypothetical protein D5125_17140 [Magnetovirga frankeli]|uniref:hypothetical protein n=1 Tax=Magnetovirga frankeli TaxID=947516 RepID=UPI0012933AE9|nr:hypothetical protein D5125_17140 [gamma proteobacterium SS-5]
MTDIRLINHSTAIKFLFVFLCLTALLACTHEYQTITGKVVDESNVALNGVAVTACYSGWGWSDGQLVWDKVFCSEPIVTNIEGRYVINFKGPEFLRLRANKKGWIQTQDFNSKDSNIILIQNAVNSARVALEANLREEKSRQRLADESDIDYYCRVVIPRNRPVRLNYQGEALSIVTSFLFSDYYSAFLFAVRGSALPVNSFRKEAELRINGKTVKTNLLFKPNDGTCEPDFYFIGSTLHSLNLEPVNQLEILIPSIRAMFDMQKWTDTVILK